MMKTIYFFAFFVGFVAAAIQPNGPVYRSATAVSATSQKQLQQQQNQGVTAINQPAQPQPLAEERESTAYQTAESAPQPSVGVNPSPSTVVSQSVVPDYTSYYYANNGQYVYPASIRAAPYPQQAPTTNQGYQNAVSTQAFPVGNQAAGYQQSTAVVEPTFWEKYHVADVLVGGAALGLVAGGAALWYPKIPSMRARAMRELADVKVEDASNLFKTLMRAIEKYQQPQK